MPATLYERLGGRDRITAIANDLVEAHLVNPLIRQRFLHLDAEGVRKIKHHVVEFFCAGSGGSANYTGRDMLSTHKGMNINEQELVAAIDDVVAAMRKHGVADAECNEVVGILYSLKGDVVRV
ncbi:group 1 truncated hemoglobin [Stella sp.]|uniref:group I truncated hemoglobin n=1 Tax=Stella sp. TaxID=2912054 RepID=UPI0035B2B8D6